MPLSIATWNINSIRARKERFLAWLEARRPDALCLQETKVVDDDFPQAEIEQLGYTSAIFGQKTYNGVAILSRTPISDVQRGMGDGVDDPQARLISGVVQGVRLVSCYVPNGSEVDSEKYAYKMAWLKRLTAYLLRTAKPTDPLVVCGDFNVAPRESDVAYPEAWVNTVLYHPTARAALEEVTRFGLVDVLAEKVPEGGVYSWWDYRQLAFPRGDGLRIDLLYATGELAKRCQKAWIDREARKGKLPSDHAPVIGEFA